MLLPALPAPPILPVFHVSATTTSPVQHATPVLISPTASTAKTSPIALCVYRATTPVVVLALPAQLTACNVTQLIASPATWGILLMEPTPVELVQPTVLYVRLALCVRAAMWVIIWLLLPAPAALL